MIFFEYALYKFTLYLLSDVSLLSSEQGWQTAHSPWQGLQLGTPCLLNYETPHLGLRFYRISKLTCTIIILATRYKFF